MQNIRICQHFLQNLLKKFTTILFLATYLTIVSEFLCVKTHLIERVKVFKLKQSMY